METYQRRKGEARSLAGCKDGTIFHVKNWLIHRSEGEQIWGLWLSIQREKGFKTCARIWEVLIKERLCAFWPVPDYHQMSQQRQQQLGLTTEWGKEVEGHHSKTPWKGLRDNEGIYKERFYCPPFIVPCSSFWDFTNRPDDFVPIIQQKYHWIPFTSTSGNIW